MNSRTTYKSATKTIAVPTECDMTVERCNFVFHSYEQTNQCSTEDSYRLFIKIHYAIK